MLLPQPSKCWDYRRAPPCLSLDHFHHKQTEAPRGPATHPRSHSQAPSPAAKPSSLHPTLRPHCPPSPESPNSCSQDLKSLGPGAEGRGRWVAAEAGGARRPPRVPVPAVQPGWARREKPQSFRGAEGGQSEPEPHSQVHGRLIAATAGHRRPAAPPPGCGWPGEPRAPSCPPAPPPPTSRPGLVCSSMEARCPDLCPWRPARPAPLSQ
jgi:hypothetical protein